MVPESRMIVVPGATSSAARWPIAILASGVLAEANGRGRLVVGPRGDRPAVGAPDDPELGQAREVAPDRLVGHAEQVDELAARGRCPARGRGRRSPGGDRPGASVGATHVPPGRRHGAAEDRRWGRSPQNTTPPNVDNTASLRAAVPLRKAEIPTEAAQPAEYGRARQRTCSAGASGAMGEIDAGLLERDVRDGRHDPAVRAARRSSSTGSATSAATSTCTSARRRSRSARSPRSSPTTTSSAPTAGTATRSPRATSPRRMMAELFGRETGYCRGRGGSMHVASRVGPQPRRERDRRAAASAIAVGAALAIRQRGGARGRASPSAATARRPTGSGTSR